MADSGFYNERIRSLTSQLRTTEHGSKEQMRLYAELQEANRGRRANMIQSERDNEDDSNARQLQRDFAHSDRMEAERQGRLFAGGAQRCSNSSPNNPHAIEGEVYYYNGDPMCYSCFSSCDSNDD